MSPRRRRSLAVVSALTTLLVVVFGVASAYGAWTVVGTGAGKTTAGALVAPSVTATRSASAPTSAIDVTWTAAGQVAGVTYTVTRNATTIACTSSPCADTGLAANTSYTYVVTAKLSNWTATGTASASTSAATPATKFGVAAPASVTAGVTSPITITAQRGDNSTDTSYTGTKTIAWSGTGAATSPGGTAPTLATSVSFTNGVGTVSNAVLTTAGSNLSLSATAGALTGSTTTTVNAAAASKLGFWTAQVTKASTTTTYDCIFSCAFDGLGSNGAITTKVAIFDTYGNTPANRTSDLNVTVTRAGQAGGPFAVTIPTGATISSGTVSANGGTANYTITLTAQASGFTNGTASISK